jgi:RNA recognition motif-containing protein
MIEMAEYYDPNNNSDDKYEYRSSYDNSGDSSYEYTNEHYQKPKHKHIFLKGFAFVLAMIGVGAGSVQGYRWLNETRSELAEYTSETTRVISTEKSTENTTTETVTEERPHHPRVEIDPDKATSIFISIGKNRRVYPRDLVGLIVAVGGIDRERIGDIKVLANYSFVQLYTEDCQTVIDKLNGYDYRGRKLAVSFSRQKSDAEEAGSAEEEVPLAEETAAAETSAEMSAEDAAAYAAAEKAAADKEPFGTM